MSLRIRRGTEAQRTGATFDLGEIVYATDTNKLYVGDGVNLGGKNILATSAGTGLAWDSATQTIRFSGLGTGIINVQADTNPTLGGNLILNSRNITGTGNISITGTVTTNGTVTAGNIFTAGTVTAGNIFTAGTLRTNTGLGGNLPLNGFNITGTGNITGNVITATTVTSASVTVPDASLGLQIESKKDSSFAVGYYNGTSAVKTAITANSDIGAISIKGWNGSVYQFAGAVFASWEAGAVTTDNAPLSTITLASGKGGDDNQFASLDSKGIWLSPISKTTVYSVAGTALPSAVTVGQGARAFVSDATEATFATAYAGSGSNRVPVYSDGTVWRIG